MNADAIADVLSEIIHRAGYDDQPAVPFNRSRRDAAS